MNSNNANIQDLKEIRNLMESSTRFLSLSGLSGIVAGLFAIIGAIIAYMVLDYGSIKYDENFMIINDYSNYNVKLMLVLVFISVLVLAAISGVYFSWRKAKKNKTKLWNSDVL